MLVRWHCFLLFDLSIPVVAIAALIIGIMRLETTVLWLQSAWANGRVTRTVNLERK